MADVITNSKTLKIETVFVDGDTRTITLRNPKSDITESEITALNTFMQSNNVLIGDKAEGTFGKINEVRIVNEQRRELDLS